MERDKVAVVTVLCNIISTHTLTWSVTLLYRSMAILNCISTHTLTWSVTVTLGFQHITISISTHTLTWSVTKLVSDIDVESLNFNSHAHVERDSVKILRQ